MGAKQYEQGMAMGERVFNIGTFLGLGGVVGLVVGTPVIGMIALVLGSAMAIGAVAFAFSLGRERNEEIENESR